MPCLSVVLANWANSQENDVDAFLIPFDHPYFKDGDLLGIRLTGEVQLHQEVLARG
jgi:hypothetical protein